MAKDNILKNLSETTQSTAKLSPQKILGGNMSPEDMTKVSAELVEAMNKEDFDTKFDITSGEFLQLCDKYPNLLPALRGTKSQSISFLEIGVRSKRDGMGFDHYKNKTKLATVDISTIITGDQFQTIKDRILEEELSGSDKEAESIHEGILKSKEKDDRRNGDQSELEVELRDFAAQMGISPDRNTEEFRDLVVDYIQKKVVGVFDMSSTTATQLLGKPEATAEYQSMLDETFTAFDFKDPESDRIRENATTPDKLIELDKKYYQKQKDFAEEQKKYRQQKGNSTADKAASFYHKQHAKQRAEQRAAERAQSMCVWNTDIFETTLGTDANGNPEEISTTSSYVAIDPEIMKEEFLSFFKPSGEGAEEIKPMESPSGPKEQPTQEVTEAEYAQMEANQHQKNLSSDDPANFARIKRAMEEDVSSDYYNSFEKYRGRNDDAKGLIFIVSKIKNQHPDEPYDIDRDFAENLVKELKLNPNELDLFIQAAMPEKKEVIARFVAVSKFMIAMDKNLELAPETVEAIKESAGKDQGSNFNDVFDVFEASENNHYSSNEFGMVLSKDAKNASRSYIDGTIASLKRDMGDNQQAKQLADVKLVYENLKKVSNIVYRIRRQDENFSDLKEAEIQILPSWLSGCLKAKDTCTEENKDLLEKLEGGAGSISRMGIQGTIEATTKMYAADSKPSQEVEEVRDAAAAVSEAASKPLVATGGPVDDESFYNEFYLDPAGNIYNKMSSEELHDMPRADIFDKELAKMFADGLYAENQLKYKSTSNQSAASFSISSKIAEPVGYISFFENCETPSLSDISSTVGLDEKELKSIIQDLISDPAGKKDRPINLNNYLKIQQALEAYPDSILAKSTASGFSHIEHDVVKNMDADGKGGPSNNYTLEFSNQIKKEDSAKSATGNPSLTIKKDDGFFKSVKEFAKDNGGKAAAYRNLQNKVRSFSGMESGIGRHLYNQIGLAMLSETAYDYENTVDVMAAIKTIPQGILLKAQFAIENNNDPSKNTQTIIDVLVQDKSIDHSMATHIANSKLIMVNSNRTGTYEKSNIKIKEKELKEVAESVCGKSGAGAVSNANLISAVNAFASNPISDLDVKDLTVLSSTGVMDYLAKGKDGRSDMPFLDNDSDKIAFLNKIKDLRRASRNIDAQKEVIERDPLEAKEYGNRLDEVIPLDNESRAKMGDTMRETDREFNESDTGTWKNTEVNDANEASKRKYKDVSTRLKSMGSTSTTDLNEAWKTPANNIGGFLKTFSGAAMLGAKDIFKTLVSGEEHGELTKMLKTQAWSNVKSVSGDAFNKFDVIKNNRILGRILPDSWNANFKHEEEEKTKEQKASIAAYAEMFEEMQERKVIGGTMPNPQNQIDFSNLNAAYPNYYGDSVINDFAAGKISSSFYLGDAISSYNDNSERGVFSAAAAEASGRSQALEPWEGNPLGLGSLTSGASEYMRQKVKENAERNKNVKRGIIASAVAEISPIDKAPEKAQPKDKIIDNIIAAAIGPEKCLDLKDFQAIVSKLTGEPIELFQTQSEEELINTLTDKKVNYLQGMSTSTRTTIEVINSDNNTTMSNVNITLDANGGGFKVYGRAEVNAEEEEGGAAAANASDMKYSVCEGNQQNVSPEEEEKLKAMFNDVDLVDIITAGSNDPGRLRNHIDFAGKYITDVNKRKIKSLALYNNILVNVYNCQTSSEGEKRAFVEKIIKDHLDEAVIEDQKTPEQQAKLDLEKIAIKDEGNKENPEASDGLVSKFTKGISKPYSAARGKVKQAAIGMSHIFGSHTIEAELTESHVRILAEYKLLNQQGADGSKIDIAREKVETMLENARNTDQKLKIEAELGVSENNFKKNAKSQHQI